MFIIYDLIFGLLAIIYLPIYLFRRKFHQGFLLRLGILPRALKLNRPIWIHAVSVGEVMAIRGLWENLRRVYPQKNFIISTVTTTGNRIARTIAQDTDFVTYLPLDFSFIVKAVLDKVKPSLFIVAETEIWPNLISYLKRLNIPVIVVNGRISDSSFRGYVSIKLLLKPILNKIDIFCAQTNRDARRLIRLGVLQDRIKITGNMKFDIADYTSSYRRLEILKNEEKLFVAASTHSGEEEVVLNVYKNLWDEFPNLRLLIAPRHPERAKDIEKIVIKYGFNSMRISQSNEQTGKQTNKQTVFILDTVGQLISFYAIADIVFVGGSLVRVGGHNILEPASFGKLVLFGPYMFNFRDIVDLFLKNQAAILVHNQEELQEKIKHLLNHPQEAIELSRQAKELILKNQGATQRNLEFIVKMTGQEKEAL